MNTSDFDFKKLENSNVPPTELLQVEIDDIDFDFDLEYEDNTNAKISDDRPQSPLIISVATPVTFSTTIHGPLLHETNSTEASPEVGGIVNNGEMVHDEEQFVSFPEAGPSTTSCTQNCDAGIFSDDTKAFFVQGNERCIDGEDFHLKVNTQQRIQLPAFKANDKVQLVMLRKNYPDFPIDYTENDVLCAPFSIVSPKAVAMPIETSNGIHHGYEVTLNESTDIAIIFHHVSTCRSGAETRYKIKQGDGKKMELRIMPVNKQLSPTSLYFQVVTENRKTSSSKRRLTTPVRDGPMNKVVKVETDGQDEVTKEVINHMNLFISNRHLLSKETVINFLKPLKIYIDTLQQAKHHAV